MTASILWSGSLPAAETEFTFGGYAKLDIIGTDYLDGDVPNTSPLRDFHFPAAIPVGGEGENHDLDFHAKESRFHLQTDTRFDNGRSIKSFVEVDFMLSDAGDERVSNSFQPRLRQFFFAYDNWLFGQTWSTFMVVTMPDDLDFPGAAEGVVFIRQPQVRYTRGGWQFSIENPETSVTPYGGGARIDTETGRLPDVVARRNWGGDWGGLSLAGIVRQLAWDDLESTDDATEIGYGLTFGGTLKVGERDDLRLVATYGSGLGRYVAFNFVNSGVLTESGGLEPIDTLNGYLSYLHHWNDRWRSSVNVSAFEADNDPALTGGEANKSARSASINLLYAPQPELLFGVELMRGERELENGTDGAFNRVQISAKYSFSFSSKMGEG